MAGLSPKNPLKYVGPNVFLPIVVSRNREPTGADYRQPETGKLYALNTFWIISKDPTTGVEGDLWYLAKIVANVAFWYQLSTGTSGPLVDITVDAVTAPGVNPVTPDSNSNMVISGAAVAQHAVPLETHSRGLHEFNVEIQYSTTSASTTANKSGISHYDSSSFAVDANGFVTLSGTGAGKTITGDDSLALSPTANNWNLFGQQAGTIPVMQTNGTALNSIMRFENRAWTTPFIVDPSSTVGLRGTFTTIASAIAAAVSGQTIFVRTGTYVENLALKVGVNICAFGGDDITPNVTIQGKATLSTAGTCTFSNIRFLSNADNILALTGSAASTVWYDNCKFTVVANDCFSQASSSGLIVCENCEGNITSGSPKYIDQTAAGNVVLRNCNFQNAANSMTASTASAGVIRIAYSDFRQPITTSGSGVIQMKYSVMDIGSTNNNTCITHGGAVNDSELAFNYFNSGSATALTITSTIDNVNSCVIRSSNADAISGAGNIRFSNLSFTNSQNINVTTQTGGIARGLTNTNSPSSGFIGEKKVSAIASGSAVSLAASGTVYNITSISLTAGIWDVSSVTNFSNLAITGTGCATSISQTSATQGTLGDNRVDSPTVPTAAYALSLTIPSYRIEISSTTTVYLVAEMAYTVGSPTAYGRISATRVG